ncbi:MAG: cobyric acid synthase, partial [Candidatus Eremiobacteraeota bacterium]|nr:cobyric acid synthase [Candidatus Eremiobacteraeota bacterium]
MRARAVMVLGTGSHVGKSLLTTALCRILRQDGYRVAPFKAQNMSLNSAATPDGGEIGRAQALQAEAAGIAPTVDMNPILLKPTSDRSSQVIVRGRIWQDATAVDYHRRRTRELFAIVCESYERLAATYDAIVLEGAGSPAEINLRSGDIVNMRMAHAADARCLLVGDIDRGGVFASLFGTIALLDDADRARIAGTIVNKFRGDLALFEPALPLLEEKTGRPCFGVVPYLPDVGLEEEDGLGLDAVRIAKRPPWIDADVPQRRARIAVVAWPAIANYTDFDALLREPSVELAYVETADALHGADLVIIPGSKSTLASLRWLEASGIGAALRAGVAPFAFGVCGGMQAMGERIDDPHEVEGGGSASGLGMLAFSTTLVRQKVCERASGEIVAPRMLGCEPSDRRIDGYEIHVGATSYGPSTLPFARIVRESDGRSLDDGAISADGRAIGTYLHGIFDNDSFRATLVTALRSARGLAPTLRFGKFRA